MEIVDVRWFLLSVVAKCNKNLEANGKWMTLKTQAKRKVIVNVAKKKFKLIPMTSIKLTSIFMHFCHMSLWTDIQIWCTGAISQNIIINVNEWNQSDDKIYRRDLLNWIAVREMTFHPPNRFHCFIRYFSKTSKNHCKHPSMDVWLFSPYVGTGHTSWNQVKLNIINRKLFPRKHIHIRTSIDDCLPKLRRTTRS